ncbi:hypothetical protein CASFOL_023068 [Castilleja foliolosa]|uniref:DUF7653 domain-containing protein n=1 Tax=Castilleja foliolosa TaxID=1961234 RepID=A0ABD3CLD8_9LAMI
MKKLFFFRSNSSNVTKNDQISPPSTDKQVSWEKTTDKSDKSAKNKHGPEDQVVGTTRLRRSLSFSSGSLFDSGKGKNGNQPGSPCSASYYSNKKSGHHRSSSSRPQTPERQTRSNRVRNSHRAEKFECNVSRAHSDLSEISSYCSSNVSDILDRYIDGEQQMFENGNAVVKRPPALQFTAPAVSRDGRKQRPKSQSLTETKLSAKYGADSGYCNESPRKLAKDVVERLSQSQYLHKLRSQELDHHDSPITIEDIYGKNFNRGSDAYADEASPKKCLTDRQTETSHEEILEKYSFAGDTDLELYKKFKEAEDRAMILSEEFKKGNFPFQYRELSVPALLQTVRTLTEEKVNMALEVSSVLEDMITEKAFYREKIKMGKVEVDSRTRKLEKEKNELQVSLEKELDRKSTEWSHKLEKLKAEESRLQERVRELAEQNVYLQNEVSSSSEREMDVRTKITLSEKQFVDLSIQAKDAMEENRYLQNTLSQIQEKARAAEDERDSIRRSHEEKVTECKDMHRSISRLQRTCSEQEKTIDGMRGLCEALGKKISQEQFDFGTTKLQAEHMRLTRVEHALRKEVELCRGEVDSLRRENIDLLNRLSGKEGSFSTFKLDRELENRVGCLNSRIVSLLAESSQLGRKLIEFVKVNSGFIVKNGQGCLDGQVIVECEVKLQSLERAAENVMNGVWTISSVLQEKTTPSLGDESQKWNEQKPEDINRSALKAETLLTSLLREKLYSKELDLEQMQAELAAAVRGNDVLKCELQNAVDNCSCINHKMKELGLQMMKKEETINQLQGDLQECKKELAVVRGILPKVSEERDMLWEEVKRYSEKNMLLNSEINVLRKKIDELDEDILVKEGQITILKDSLGKPFDLLASPDSTDNFYSRDKH